MKGMCIVLLAFVAASVHTSALNQKPQYDLNYAPAIFLTFMSDYNRHYKNDYDLLIHYEAFKKSLISINHNNKQDYGATFGINAFADYTPEEMSHMYGIPPIKPKI